MSKALFFRKFFRYDHWTVVALIFFCCPIHALTFNLFSSNNGAGLESHRKLMQKALESLGHTVYNREFNEVPTPPNSAQSVDINIFMEIICKDWFSCAKLNWLVPNPECYVQELSLLQQIDLVLCFTRESERIFQELGRATYFSGFTSFDCCLNKIEKNFSQCIHIAGKSNHKGTKAVIDAWRYETALPQLTLIQHHIEKPIDVNYINWISRRIPEDQLRYAQNHCGIHLCPSETEGFGHYIMEAMSAGSVVITTDAPPMNEFITDKRCLVPYQKTAPFFLATCYYISSEDLAEIIHHLQTLPESDLKKIGEENRLTYERITAQFHINLKKLLDKVEKNFKQKQRENT